MLVCALRFFAVVSPHPFPSFQVPFIGHTVKVDYGSASRAKVDEEALAKMEEEERRLKEDASVVDELLECKQKPIKAAPLPKRGGSSKPKAKAKSRASKAALDVVEIDDDDDDNYNNNMDEDDIDDVEAAPRRRSTSRQTKAATSTPASSKRKTSSRSRKKPEPKAKTTSKGGKKMRQLPLFMS